MLRGKANSNPLVTYCLTRLTVQATKMNEKCSNNMHRDRTIVVYFFAQEENEYSA